VQVHPAAISPPQINANIAMASEEHYQGVAMKSKTSPNRPL